MRSPRWRWLFPAALLLPACAAKPPPVSHPPYPFTNGVPPAAIALLSYPDKERTEGLAGCLRRYEGVALLSEGQVLSAMRRAGLAPEDFERETQFSRFRALAGLNLFFYLYGDEEKPLLTVVDVRNRGVTRYRLERNPHNCEKLFSTLGFFRITSDPSGVDTFIDGRYYGRTPLLVPLTGEKHRIELFAPQGVFPRQDVFPPADQEAYFQKQLPASSDKLDEQGDFKSPPSGNERVGEVMMIIGAGALIAGAIFFPLYFIGL